MNLVYRKFRIFGIARPYGPCGMAQAGLLAALLVAAGSVRAEPLQLTILTEYSPPSSMFEDGREPGSAGGSGGGKVVGTGSDKVREVMARTGVAFTIAMQPWRRAYTAALEQSDTCVYAATRLPEREHLFRWIGPIDSGDWVLLGRADRRYALRTLDDARRFRIGTYNGDARDAYLRERGFNVDAAQNDLINPEKLLLGRIDLWAASLRRHSTLLAQRGWAGRIVPVLSFKKVELYLACNKTMTDDLAARMNGALRAMQRDGTMKKIERRYEGRAAAAAAKADTH
jgi:polar amino acid transport system substrate-binding protein